MSVVALIGLSSAVGPPCAVGPPSVRPGTDVGTTKDTKLMGADGQGSVSSVFRVFVAFNVGFVGSGPPVRALHCFGSLGRLSLHPAGESLPTGWTQATEDQQLLSYRPIHIRCRDAGRWSSGRHGSAGRILPDFTGRPGGTRLLPVKPRPRTASRAPRPLLSGLVLALALGLRVANLIDISDSPFFTRPVVDGRAYDRWALAIIGRAESPQAEATANGPFYQDPLYPYFLALIYTVFGHSYWAVYLLQFALALVFLLLVYDTARRLFDWRAGIALILAAFAMTLYPVRRMGKPETAQSLATLASDLYHESDTAEAIATYEEALRNQPGQAEASRNLGVIMLSRNDAARVEFRKAIALEPGRAELRFDLASALQVVDSYPHALAQYDTMLQLAPDNPVVRHNYAVCLYNLGRLDEVRTQLEFARRLGSPVNPKFDSLLNSGYRPNR